MSDFTIKGNVGDAFIRITSEGEVQLIFGEDDVSITRDMSWEGHEIYKTAVQFALMVDSHIRNSKALDDLIVNSATGSIPAELLDSGLLPISLMGAGMEIVDFEVEDMTEDEPYEEKIPMGLKKKDNVIQFKKRKNDEDK
jgi:hypothetical protein